MAFGALREMRLQVCDEFCRQFLSSDVPGQLGLGEPAL
jgi:hypothetical protein